MSRRSLGTLTIDVIAEIGGFASGLDKSERRTEKWRQNIEKQAKLAGVALGTAIAAGMVLIARNTVAAEREVAQLDAIIKSTGGAAGYTRQQLLDMADTLSSKSTFSGGEIVEAQTRLLSYSGILGTNIPRAMQAIIDQSARLGISVSQSAETIGRALESPSKAAAALAQQGFGAAFTKEVRGTIDELVKAGKEGEAQVMILEILEESYGGAAQAARDTFGGALLALRNTLDDLTTGNSGSLKAATNAVNDLTKVLNDPEVREGFDVIISGALKAVSALGKLVEMGARYPGWLSGKGFLPVDEDDSLAALEARQARLKSTLGAWPGLFDSETKGKVQNEYAQVGKWIEEARAKLPKPILLDVGHATPGFVSGVTGDPAARAAAAATAADAENQKKREAAAKVAARAAESARQALQKSFESTDVQLRRQIELFDTSTDKSAQATELQKLNFDLAETSLKSLNAEEKERLRTSAATLDRLKAVKLANEEAAKSAEFARNAQAALDNARDALAVEFVGAGEGGQARERARDLLQIEADYQKQRQALFEQYQSGDITESLYKTETQTLQSALDERLRMQEDHYRKLDELRGDWQAGMADAWADYATKAADANQQAYDAVTGFLDTTTGDVAESIADLVKGNESLSESVKNLVVSMGETVIDTLSRMAAQWLVYQATQKLVGEATSQSSTAALTGNAVAMSAQAAIAAYASTAAIPITGPIAAPAAAAAALAATAPYVAAVAASSGLSGMAHDGIDAVPETGTWLLQKGERVTTAATSAKLDATLERVNRDTSGGFSGPPITQEIQINGNPDNRTLELVRKAALDGAQMGYDRVKSDMARGTGISRTMRGTHNVGRKVR
ncbi:phage tail tape measure protein [Stenotrophomonas bentonitica]